VKLRPGYEEIIKALQEGKTEDAKALCIDILRSQPKLQMQLQTLSNKFPDCFTGSKSLAEA